MASGNLVLTGNDLLSVDRILMDWSVKPRSRDSNNPPVWRDVWGWLLIYVTATLSKGGSFASTACWIDNLSCGYVRI
jgi:hypothetical protein